MQKKLRWVYAAVAVVLIFGFGLWLGFFVPRMIGVTSNLKIHSSAAILRQVQTVSQLVTVKYVIEKVVVLEDVKWFGENRMLFVAHGVVTAGVDLNRLEPGDIEVNGQKIRIQLPPAQVMDTFLDEKQSYVVEHSTGLLRTFDKNLETTARQTAVDDIRRAARNSGILKDATERAQLQLRALLAEMGFQAEVVGR